MPFLFIFTMINAFFPHSKSNDDGFLFIFFKLLDANENFYYCLYESDYFYAEIRNGLNALVSLHVDNFLHAHRELYNFCTRTHHTITAPLCEPCTVTKDLIREVVNEEHPETLLFYRTSSYFNDG